MPDILPDVAGAAERALVGAIAAALDVSMADVRPVWNVDTCPPAFLPFLAWAVSVDAWDEQWSDGLKRAIIRASIAAHRLKGTAASVKAFLAGIGYPSATITEYPNLGYVAGGGGTPLPDPTYWATYDVTLVQPITTDQANVLRALLGMVAPARCHLGTIDYTEAAYTYDAAIDYDGAYNYGDA